MPAAGKAYAGTGAAAFKRQLGDEASAQRGVLDSALHAEDNTGAEREALAAEVLAWPRGRAPHRVCSECRKDMYIQLHLFIAA